ncbi:hypothetical protein FRC17_009834 [Serendipita sp. 399]|nr:hypothetical protein FRC17_009834 [Serendipita sp. 399]
MAASSSSRPVVLALSNTITPALAVEILPLGLAVNSIYLNADGETHDIVEGPFDSKLHETPPYKYMNTLVGRYANRIPVKADGHKISKGGYEGVVNVVKNGKSFSTLQIDFARGCLIDYLESDKVSLHGGPNTLDAMLFESLKLPESKLFSETELRALHATDYAHQLFTATLADNHNGFPGTLRIEVLFTVINPEEIPVVSNPNVEKHVSLGSLLVVYRARILEPSKVTPVNLTQHWGFNLEASLRPTPHLNVRDHNMRIDSEARIAIDTDLLPTGELEQNGGTPHDHTTGKKIGDLFPEHQNGYDHFYLFPQRVYDASIATQPPRVQAAQLSNTNLLTELLSSKPAENPEVELWSEKSGYKVAFSSNQGGVQCYTANFQNGAGTRKKIHGGSAEGDGYPKEACVYLEFHDPLSAFLHPQNGIDSLLTSDEIYHNYVKLNFGFKPLARS